MKYILISCIRLVFLFIIIWCTETQNWNLVYCTSKFILVTFIYRYRWILEHDTSRWVWISYSQIVIWMRLFSHISNHSFSTGSPRLCLRIPQVVSDRSVRVPKRFARCSWEVLTAETRVQSGTSSREIFGDQVALGQAFLRELGIPLTVLFH